MGRTVSIKVLADVAGYMSGMRRAAVATKEFSGELGKAAAGGKAEQISRATAAIGIGLVGVAAGAVKMSMDFDKSMSAAAAATRESSKSAKENAQAVDQLRQAALQAGKDTQFSATDAANGITELGKAGVRTGDILSGGLKGALDLAAAGQISVGEAAETAASAMTQFKLQGSQLPHVADLLAAGAGKAQGSVHDIGMALNQTGLVAAQFGLSIEDTTGALAEFASAGLTGSDAGTSFKTMLLAIANPTQQTKNMMDELGISFYDAQGKFIGISGVAQVLQTRFKGLTDAQRQQALGQLFGNDAIRAASILYTDGADGVKKWKDNVNDTGYATKNAAALTDNLAGDLERLKGSLETLAISSGSGANSGLRILVKSLDSLVGRFLDLPPAVGGTLTVLAGVGGVTALALAGFVKLRKGANEVITELKEMGPVGERAAAGLGRTAAFAGRAAAVLGGLQIAAAGISAISSDLNPQIDALGVGLEQFGSSGKLSGEAARVLGGDMGKLDTAMKDIADTGRWSSFARGFGGAMESISGTSHSFDDSIGNSRDRLAAVDQALQQLVQGGNAAQAAQVFQMLADRAAKQGVSVNELKKVLPGYAATLETTGAASKTTADKLGDLNSALDVGAAGQNKYKTAADAAAGAARGEREALGALFTTLKAETDPVFALIDAQKKLKDAQKAYSAAVKAHGKNSAEARAADLDLAKAALGLQGAVGDLSGEFHGKLDPAFVKTLQAAGLTKSQIADVAKQFESAKKSADKYNGNYAAKTSAPGAKQAKTELDNAYASAHHLDGTWEAKTSAPGAKDAKHLLDIAYTSANNFAGPYKASVSVTGYPEALGKLSRLSVYQQALKNGKIPPGFNGPIKGPDGKYYADGGQVGGWSPHSRADNIPAWLTANEWVHPVASVNYYGPQVMRAIQHRQVPREVLEGFATGQLGKLGDLPLGLADGGPVLWRFLTTAAHTRIPSRAEVESKVGGQAGGFLRAQNGKPYIWASAGPNGYDCSGIASAVYNLLHGRNPYHHTFSTASLPGGWFPKHGIGGPLTVAWSNPGESPASSTTGHMMGMAGGLTFESTGSRGVHLGSSTRRLGDFAHIAHYSNGGPVEAGIAMNRGGTITEPVFGIGASGRTYSFGENYMPERVTPGWGAGGGNTYVISPVFTGPVGSRAELSNWLTGAIDDLRRRGRI